MARASFGSAARNAATAVVVERAVSGRGRSRADVAVDAEGTYIPSVNMMWALGVPASISQGLSADGTVLSPVVASVAKGM